MVTRALRASGQKNRAQTTACALFNFAFVRLVVGAGHDEHLIFRPDTTVHDAGAAIAIGRARAGVALAIQCAQIALVGAIET